MRTHLAAALLLAGLVLACGGPKKHRHNHHRPQGVLGEVARFDGACKDSGKEAKLDTKGTYFLVLLVEGDCPVSVSGFKDEEPKEYEPGTTLGRGFEVPEGGATLKLSCKTSEKEEKCQYTAWAGVPGKPEGEYTYVKDQVTSDKCDGGSTSIIVNGQATVEVAVADGACKVKVAGTDGGEKEVDSANGFSDKVSPDSGTPWKTVTVTCGDDASKKCDFTYSLKKKQ